MLMIFSDTKLCMQAQFVENGFFKGRAVTEMASQT